MKILWGGKRGQEFHKTFLRITQEALEVLRLGDPYLRITQEALEVLRLGLPYASITQEALEVLRATWCVGESGGTVDSVLTNPGAETGDITGWTVASGAFVAAATAPATFFPSDTASPHTGDYLFTGGASASYSVYQDIDLLDESVPAGAIDGEVVSVKFDAWYCDLAERNNRLKLAFLDTGSSEISNIASDWVTGYSIWRQTTLYTYVPADTRYIRAYLEGGNGNPCYANFDDVTLTIEWCGGS